MIDRFRRRPLYSADNEDTRTELAVLEIDASDDVAVIKPSQPREVPDPMAAPWSRTPRFGPGVCRRRSWP